ncbi:MAG: stage 0 sporulation family protein [Clostridiales bacterium]|nr:stage 0 sporulation family protein [Clostridiales bacterium]
MPKVLGVKFRTSPRIYFFAPNEEEEYSKGDVVVVETQRGVEMATVVQPPRDVEESALVAPLKPVVRIATEADLEAEAADNAQKRKILATVKEKVAARGLDMKVCDCEFTVDHSKLVLYFTAEQRVDFRDLVRDLASTFHIRIDLRQIGPRDECKLVGALGSCGQPCCCGRFESDSEHVSIKMAKNQNLALTPNKINGMCGRLLCCLAYENATYEDVAKRAPKVGTIVGIPDGRRALVQSVTPLTETVRVRVGGDDNFETLDFKIDELTFDKQKPERPDPAEKNKHGGGKPQGGAPADKPKAEETAESEEKEKTRGERKPFDKNRQNGKKPHGNNDGKKQRPPQGDVKPQGSGEAQNGGKRDNKHGGKKFNKHGKPHGKNGGNKGNGEGAANPEA